MGEQIKPCPFCGLAVAITSGGKNDGLLSFVCEEGSLCRGSGIVTCCLAEDLPKAVAAWNRRSEGPHPESGEFSDREKALMQLVSRWRIKADVWDTQGNETRMKDFSRVASELGELIQPWIDARLASRAPPLEGAGRAEDGSSQGLGGHPCGERDGAETERTAALAITEDVSKAVAPDLAGIVKVAVRLAISDGEYIGRWSIRGMNPTEVIDVRERAEKARIDLILHHPSARFRERRNASSGGWLPIETAPRDGRPILVGHASSAFDAYWSPTEGEDGQGAWVDGTTDRYEDMCVFEPTHWMPLPSPPGATASTTPNIGTEKVAAEVVQPIRDEPISPSKGEALPVAWRAKLGDNPFWMLVSGNPTGDPGWHSAQPLYARPVPGVSREEVAVTDEMVKRASIAFDEYVATIPPNDEVDTEPCVRAALEAALLSRGEG